MKPARFLFIGAVVATMLCGCRPVTWVDVDPSGCSAATVEQMNKDPELVRSMASVCTLQGNAAPGDRLRCHDHTLQVACRP